MSVLFCGTFDPTTPRARQYVRLAAMSEHGSEVLNFPVWGAKRDSSFGIGWLAKFPSLAIAYVRLLRRLLRGPKVDTVVFLYPGYVDALVLGWAAHRCARVTILDQFISIYDTVVLDRALIAERNPLSFVLRWLDMGAMRAVDRVVFDTPQHQGFAEAHLGLESHKARLLWVGADATVFRSSVGIDDVGHVLFYGTFIPLHGTETIVRAARLLPDIDFRIIGKGQQSGYIAGMIAKLDVGNITMVEPMPEQELVEELCSARIVLGIFGTTEKAQRVVPNKVFQAAAMGKAVITESSPAIEQSLGDAVRTVPPGDAEALAEAISEMMVAGIAERFGVRAREAFDEQFSDSALLAGFGEIVD